MSITKQNLSTILKGVIAGIILLIPTSYANEVEDNQQGGANCPYGQHDVNGQCVSDKQTGC